MAKKYVDENGNQEILVSMDYEGVHLVHPKIVEDFEKKSISASLITGIETCPAKWAIGSFVESQIIEQEPDNAARRGSLFHQIMENFFALPAEERTTKRVKEEVENVLHSDEYVDLSTNPEVIAWVRDAVNGYYSMGAKPQNIKIAKLSVRGQEPQNGLEIFVKGKIGKAKRKTLGFIDRVTENTKKADGSIVVEDWKGLALDTPIPTPNGFKTMAELKEGEDVLGSNGKPTKIIKKSGIHNRDCYELEFMSNQTVTSDNVHLWQVEYNQKKHIGEKTGKLISEVLSTEELFEKFSDPLTAAFRIVNPASLDLPEKDLPIDPYLLGYWLGDGDSRGGYISVGKDDIDETFERLQKIWPTAKKILDEKSGHYDIGFPKLIEEGCSFGNIHNNRPHIDFCDECKFAAKTEGLSRKDGNNVGLTVLLKRNNLQNNKHIPEEYLFASYNQRLALLQGLMDSDGTWNKTRNRAVFGGVKEELFYNVMSLISTFGITPYHSVIEKKLSWKNNEVYDKPVYSLEFSTFSLNPFLLERKRKLVEDYTTTSKTEYMSSRKYIRNIKKVESVPTQCIGVDAEDSLYQFGENFTLTHNTGAKAKKYKKHLKSMDGWPEARQQLIYTILLRQDDIDVSGARLIFPVARDVVNVDVNDEELLAKVVEDVEKADKALDNFAETNTFEYKPSFLCAWCPAAKICQVAQIKPYAKMQEAYAKQPEPDVLLQAIELK